MIKRTCLRLILVICLLVGFLPSLVFADNTYSRYYGSDRIATALTVCDAGWSAGSWAVILAPADQANLVDALAVSSLAGQKDIPILLTYKDSLDQRVINKIANIHATTVYVIGAISDPVYEQVANMSGVTTVRIKGKDRWETAKKINDYLLTPAGTIVVGYDSMADALSASSYAAAHRYALVLADSQGRIPAGQNLYGSSTIIVGNTDKVRDISGAVRISGTDSFARNEKLIEKLSFSYDKIYIANGFDSHLVDALVISPLAGRNKSPVLLAGNNNIQASGIVNTMLKSTSEVIALGGTSVVSDSLRNQIKFTAPDLRVESVTPTSLNCINIRFSDKIDPVSAADPKNYYINGKDLTTGKFAGSQPVVSDDNQTVSIILNPPAGAGESLNIEINGNTIYDKSRNRTALYYKGSTQYSDYTYPVVNSVSLTGDNQLTVILSEPVKIPALSDCKKWVLDYSDLENWKLDSVTASNNVFGYGFALQLNFNASIRNGLGLGDHKLTVKAGSSEGQLSDAAGLIVYDQDLTFKIN